MIKAKLYEHQENALDLAIKFPQFGLFMEQGTGKTLVAIGVIGHRYLNGKVERVLVVGPKAAASPWTRQLREFADFPYDLHVLIDIPVESKIKIMKNLRRTSSPNLQIVFINLESYWRTGLEGAIIKWKPDMVVIDESHRIKERSSKQSRMAHRLGDRCKYKMILTGTPAPESPLDYWSQYRFLNKEIFGTRFSAFRDEYAVMHGFWKSKVKKFKNLKRLAKKVYSIAYRVTKDEALDLPPTVDEVLEARLHPKAQKYYNDMLEQFFFTLEDENIAIDAPIVITQMMKLQQITGGTLIYEVDGERKTKRIPSGKLEILQDFIHDYPKEDKVVIFARFRGEIEAIEEVVRKSKRKYVKIVGGMTSEDRIKAEEEFQDNPEVTVMIAQIKAGGISIDLTAAKAAVFYSTSFSYEEYDQARARVHRIGQKNKVTYYHIVTKDTIDEEILAALREKKTISQLVADFGRRFTKMRKKEKSKLEEKLQRLKDELERQYGEHLIDEDTEEMEEEEVVERPAKKKEKKSKKKTSGDSERVKKAPPPPVEDEDEEDEEPGDSEDIITAKELAADLGITGVQLRKKLRKLVAEGKIKNRESGRWEWPRGSKELKKIISLLG